MTKVLSSEDILETMAILVLLCVFIGASCVFMSFNQIAGISFAILGGLVIIAKIKLKPEDFWDKDK